jgi:hypothetical protein
MTLKTWNQKQIQEALGETNRYHFWHNNGRDGTNSELVSWYIQHTKQLTLFEKMHLESIMQDNL